MGMYSYFRDQELDVKDTDGLVAAGERDPDLNVLIDNLGNPDFSGWDGWKIYSYWYDQTVETLQKMAKFVEGYAEFMYEEGELFRITFHDGKAYMQEQPHIDWSMVLHTNLDTIRDPKDPKEA